MATRERPIVALPFQPVEYPFSRGATLDIYRGTLPRRNLRPRSGLEEPRFHPGNRHPEQRALKGRQIERNSGSALILMVARLNYAFFLRT